MEKIKKILLLTCIIFSACTPPTDLEKKKKEYEKAKTELVNLKSKVRKLRKTLEKAGTIKQNNNISLVTTFKLKPSIFEHDISIRGDVKSKNNITISPSIPELVVKILIKEGEMVKKNQILVVQKSEVLNNAITELRTSLDLATTIYLRQEKLWEKNIGTELHYLEAKNKKLSLEKKLKTAKSELDKAIIRAPFSGVIDRVDVRLGQYIQPGQSILRLVNLKNMYIKADVSEFYIGKFRNNQKVSISFPSIGTKLEAKVSAIGQVIESKNRTFELKVVVPPGHKVKPNMIAIITIADYKNKNALTVPTNIIFTDSKGAFVYQLGQMKDKNIAIRTDVTLGLTEGIKTEIIEGLMEGDIIIDKGIYDVSNGAEVKIVNYNK